MSQGPGGFCVPWGFCGGLGVKVALGVGNRRDLGLNDAELGHL